MSRMVVEISKFSQGESGQDQVVFRLNEPSIQGADTLCELDLEAHAGIFDQVSQGVLQSSVIKHAGELLRQRLAGHVAVQMALQLCLAQATNEATPIYLYLRAGAGESLPWELLYDPQGQFLALDRRWPVARMSGPFSTVIQTRLFAPPIRMLAFLTATGIDARPEWDALCEALTSAQVGVEVQLYVSQPELRADIAAAVLPPHVRVQVALLPETFDFRDIVSDPDRSPHIVHFFCHGSAEEGPHLQLATHADWLQGMSSVVIEPDDFARIPAYNQHLWLVTLNCCASAASGQQEVQSFARSLVANRDVPAAIGMREAVKADDAHIFSAAFYRELLLEIDRCLAAASPVTLEWAKLLHEPRWRICQQHRVGRLASHAAMESKEWSLPVLYVRSEPFQLEVVPVTTAPSEEAQLATLRAALRELAAHIPMEAVAEVHARVGQLLGRPAPV